jgi:glutathione S-transferase
MPDRPVITGFEASPDRGRGLARDMRVRWALEELGLDYDVRLLSFAALKQAEHRALHPFGQIPTYQSGEIALFETGAIVLHLAEQSPGLLPDAPAARARAIAWMFAAVSSIEPPIIELQNAVLLEADRPWHADRMPIVTQRVRERLAMLSDYLGDADWLEGAFTAGDLMVIDVLRRLSSSGLVAEFAKLSAYVARGEARPAFQRAFDAQAAIFAASQAG